jgi:zinc D-Ala-D-Ala dipeptidase
MAPILFPHHQLLLITAPSWESDRGTLLKFEKNAGEWSPVGEEASVRLGKAGLAWGVGLHPTPPKEDPIKKEGDKKSPAGLFSLGPIFGAASPAEMIHLHMPYLVINDDIEAIDDPQSLYYNRVVNRKEVTAVDWQSSEKMATDPSYKLGIVIQHNSPSPTPGAGSAIFLHITKEKATNGCTSISRTHLETLLSWLDPKKQPALLQLPLPAYHNLQSTQFPESIKSFLDSRLYK